MGNHQFLSSFGALTLSVCCLFLLISIIDSSGATLNGGAYYNYLVDSDTQSLDHLSKTHSILVPFEPDNLSRDKRQAKFQVLAPSPTVINQGTNNKNESVTVTTAKSVQVNVVTIKPSTNTNITSNSTTPASSNSTAIVSPKNSTLAGSEKNSTKLDEFDDFPEFPPSEFPSNYTTKNDTYKYYNSSYFRDGKFLWVEISDKDSDTVKHELLSNAHRRAATVNLKFDFPFYGHIVRNITIATGGFVYLGEQVHAWLAATQYVAPLMANFHSTFDNSSVKYLSNGTQFTVEWDQVHIHQNHPFGQNATNSTPPFTFQTSLYSNGTIVFAYKEIPIKIKSLNDTEHPVKVGLSDAYITDKTLLFVKSRTIFEYDRVDVKDYEITNGTGIIFTPLPTCLNYKTCHECLAADIGFKCTWCPKTSRCSDGTDRYRQDWLMRGCAMTSFDSPLQCFIGTTVKPTVKPPSDVYHHHNGDENNALGHGDHDDHKDGDHYHDHHYPNDPQKVKINKESIPKTSTGMSASGVIGLMFFFMVLFGSIGWVAYAYYYPHSPSGQLLIRFRPSQWTFSRRGEARYTAASIHM